MTVKPKAAKEEASREAKRMAAILLDVLAGVIVTIVSARRDVELDKG